MIEWIEIILNDWDRFGGSTSWETSCGACEAWIEPHYGKFEANVRNPKTLLGSEIFDTVEAAKAWCEEQLGENNEI